MPKTTIGRRPQMQRPVVFSLRLSREMLDALERRANDERREVAPLIRLAIEQYLKTPEAENARPV